MAYSEHMHNLFLCFVAGAASKVSYTGPPEKSGTNS